MYLHANDFILRIDSLYRYVLYVQQMLNLKNYLVQETWVRKTLMTIEVSWMIWEFKRLVESLTISHLTWALSGETLLRLTMYQSMIYTIYQIKCCILMVRYEGTSYNIEVGLSVFHVCQQCLVQIVIGWITSKFDIQFLVRYHLTNSEVNVNLKHEAES